MSRIAGASADSAGGAIARPASRAQRRLWLIERSGRAGDSYVASIAIAVEGRLDRAALGAALDAVAARHEPLRTIYEAAGDAPRQRILPPGPLTLGERHLRAGESLADAAAAERAIPLDLTQGPVFRATLVTRAGAVIGLVLVLHHIAFDGWSIGILARELGALYRAAVEARAAGLAPIAASYADIAERRLAREDGAEEARDLAFWRERLSGLQALDLALEPPQTRNHPAVVALPLRLTAPALARIDALATKMRTTRFTVLLALWLALVGRLGASARPAAGVAVSGRDEADAEALIGFFVDTVVIDADLSGRPSLSALVERLRRRALEAFDHRAVAFERVAEALAQERGGDGAPLFDVAFGLQQTPTPPDFGPALRCDGMTVDVGVRFGLECYLWPDGDGLSGTLIADGARVGAAALEDVRRWFLTLLARALGDPDAPLDDLALTTPQERARILGAWNAPAPPLREDKIVALVAAAAARDPAAIAARQDGVTATYRRLIAEADAIAGGLAAAGVGAGDVVAVVGGRSIRAVATLLAVLKRGAAYLALDPGQPVARLEELIADAAPALVVATMADPPALSRPAIAATALAEIGRAAPPVRDHLGPGATVAYVNYTSGSTGRPKGVIVPHRAVAALACGQDWLGLGPGRVVAHASNLAFDAATFEIWATLIAGATLEILPTETVADPPRLIAALRDRRVGVIFLTTALFNQLVDYDPAGLAGPEDVLFGGEAVDPRRVSALFAAAPPKRLWHVYGPTETTTFASRWRAPGAVETAPIGFPLAGDELYVLDAAGQLVPPGGVGELCIGGAGLAHGYLGDPAATAARFVPDAESGRPGARLYRTGDHVRLGRDGAVLFLGRIDRQVKIRGFRVEPGEIEERLTALAGVREAAVLVDERGERRLVAHVAADVDAATIRAALKTRLPAYMIPAVICVSERLPLNRAGKIDRAALATRTPAAAAPRAGRAAADPIEAEVAAQMAATLALETVGVDDDFFDLGGHSLGATRFLARLRDRFAVALGLTDVFDAPTPAALARVIAQRLAAGVGGPTLAAAPAQEAAQVEAQDHPLSFAQSRLWFLDRLGFAGAAYHSPLAFELSGPLDRAALACALDDLARRHEPLRTVFEDVEGWPRQRVRADATIALDVVDLTGRADAPAALAAALDEAVAAPFDLETDAMLRARLIALGPHRHVLALVFHHIAFDGWSLPIAIDELGRFYGARRAGRPADLAPLTLRYVDFARWQQAWFVGEGGGQAIVDRVVARLAGVEELRLPTDRARGRLARHRGGRLDVHWRADLGESLQAFARARKATLSMLLLAGFMALMQRWSGQRRVLIGSPIAGRAEAATQGMVGFFVNTMPIAVDFGGDPDFEEVVRRVRAAALEAYATQDAPFEKIVEALRPARDLARHPLFQVVFVLQDEAAMQPAPVFDGLDARLLPPGEIHVRYDLEAHLFRAADGVRGYVFYDRDLFDAATIAALERQLAALLEAGVRSPSLRLSALPLVDAQDAARLDAWSRA